MVTGGGGFLGSHVVEALHDAGCSDIFVVRSSDYDLTHEDAAAQLFSDHPADVVMHLAGYVGGIGSNKAYPADFFYRNLMMGTLIIDQAWRGGAEKVVAAGAGCGYPEQAPLPIKEEDFWQGFPQTLSAPYSLAKRMLHVQSMAYWRQHGFPVVVAIPGNIYGPYDNFDLEAAHVIPALVRKFVEAADDGHPSVTVWGSGTPTRDFVYAGDVARGIQHARQWDDDMSKARAALNWPMQFEIAFDGETARALHDEDLDVDTDFCAMCGHDWCSMRISKEIEEFASGKGEGFQPEKTAAPSPGVSREGLELLVQRGEKAACHSDNVTDSDQAVKVQRELVELNVSSK